MTSIPASIRLVAVAVFAIYFTLPAIAPVLAGLAALGSQQVSPGDVAHARNPPAVPGLNDDIAELFGVSTAWIRRLLQRRRDIGAHTRRAPCPARGGQSIWR